MKLLTPTICLEAAQAALRELTANFGEPSAIDFCAPQGIHCFGATLCHAPRCGHIVSSPRALFQQMQIPAEEIPEEWLPAYTNWLKLAQRTHELTVASLRLKRGEDRDLLISDPVAAGLLLYLSSAAIPLSTRKWLIELALTTPAGAWLMAEGLHFAEEREAIWRAVRADSRLCWWTSQITGFAIQAVQQAKSHLDLYGGFVTATHGGDEELRRWLTDMALAGYQNPDAASAALILQPTASESQKASWASSIKKAHSSRQAYETVRWARFTWSSQAWRSLRTLLRPYATAEPQWLFHWFRDVEPSAAASALGDSSVDPLWATELIDALGIVDDFALRFRLGERLGESNDPVAGVVLDWLNRRLRTK